MGKVRGYNLLLRIPDLEQQRKGEKGYLGCHNAIIMALCGSIEVQCAQPLVEKGGVTS